ncbi:small ribosomal subunit protein uS11m isoform X7 [Symphalangus syndactylus]|uniref:small ribosomal subunit protein uS11m isoform X7 n=1 Tax=Symphalangus syndactylus TaxID=9590 RepID=UPI00244204B8|nr:28S ribosomal protein S11, mitochondrial isoform X6 [Symphalangus syndactylus]
MEKRTWSSEVNGSSSGQVEVGHWRPRVQILSMVDVTRNRGLTVFFKLWEEEPTKDLKIINMGSLFSIMNILAGTRKMGSMNENPFS